MRTALVVTADPRCRRSIVATLARSGMEVRSLEPSGGGLAEAIRASECDLVVVEDAPEIGLDGLDLVRAIRANGLGCALVVVAGSAGQRIEALLAAGASAFLVRLPG